MEQVYRRILATCQCQSVVCYTNLSVTALGMKTIKKTCCRVYNSNLTDLNCALIAKTSKCVLAGQVTMVFSHL